jgi:hypothetical protein
MTANGRYYILTENASQFVRGFADVVALLRKVGWRLSAKLTQGTGDLQTERAAILSRFHEEIDRRLEIVMDQIDAPREIRAALESGSHRVRVVGAISYIETCQQTAAMAARLMNWADRGKQRLAKSPWAYRSAPR